MICITSLLLYLTTIIIAITITTTTSITTTNAATCPSFNHRAFQMQQPFFSFKLIRRFYIKTPTTEKIQKLQLQQQKLEQERNQSSSTPKPSLFNSRDYALDSERFDQVFSSSSDLETSGLVYRKLHLFGNEYILENAQDQMIARAFRPPFTYFRDFDILDCNNQLLFNIRHFSPWYSLNTHWNITAPIKMNQTVIMNMEKDDLNKSSSDNNTSQKSANKIAFGMSQLSSSSSSLPTASSSSSSSSPPPPPTTTTPSSYLGGVLDRTRNRIWHTLSRLAPSLSSSSSSSSKNSHDYITPDYNTEGALLETSSTVEQQSTSALSASPSTTAYVDSHGHTIVKYGSAAILWHWTYWELQVFDVHQRLVASGRTKFAFTETWNIILYDDDDDDDDNGSNDNVDDNNVSFHDIRVMSVFLAHFLHSRRHHNLIALYIDIVLVVLLLLVILGMMLYDKCTEKRCF